MSYLTDIIATYAAFVVVAGAAIWCYHVYGVGRQLVVTPVNWFLILQGLFLANTLVFADVRDAADVLWLVIICGGMLSVSLGAISANRLLLFNPRHEISEYRTAPVEHDLRGSRLLFFIGMAFVCVGVGIAFSRAVGYHVMLSAATDAMGGGDVDTAEYSHMRTAISNADKKYVAPGYSLQFTATLLPLIIVLAYMQAKITQKRDWKIACATLLAADLYFLTLAGGRGFVLRAVASAACLLSPYGPFPHLWPMFRRAFLKMLVFFSLFYGVTTLLMGRVSSEENSPVTVSLNLFQSFTNRMTGPIAEPQLKLARHFMGERHRPEYGKEWVESLATAVQPSVSSGTGRRMYEILYGNDRGHCGMSFWLSAWYNWGTAGTILVSYLFGLAAQAFAITYFRGPRKLSRVVILFLAGINLGQALSPYSLLLNGFVTLLICYGLAMCVPSTAMRARSSYGKPFARPGGNVRSIRTLTNETK